MQAASDWRIDRMLVTEFAKYLTNLINGVASGSSST